MAKMSVKKTKGNTKRRKATGKAPSVRRQPTKTHPTTKAPAVPRKAPKAARAELRRVERCVRGKWSPIRMRDMRKGWVFRVFEPDDTPVIWARARIFVATSDAFKIGVEWGCEAKPWVAKAEKKTAKKVDAKPKKG